MAVHDEVLVAARRLCRQHGNWRFRPLEVVRAVPHLNENTVRTHVVSRCCVNAPRNHPHKWDYFLRVGRGLYEICPRYRRSPVRGAARGRKGRRRVEQSRAVGERGTVYGKRSLPVPRETVHAVLTRDRDWFVGECLEVAVVTQGRTLDELVFNLTEAIGLHLEGEDPGQFGLVAKPRLVVTYEVATRAR